MSRFAGICVVGAIALFVSTARASFHEWRFSEVFSNAAGDIQFIEFDGPADNGESFLTGHQVTGTGNTYTFMTDLPSINTAGKHFLMGTAAYAALPGAPQPDYLIPANFFDPAGDSLNYAFVDAITIDPATFPTDGVHSFLKDGTSAVNSPTNFAGDTGSIVAGGGGNPVPLPAGVWSGLATLGIAAAMYHRRRASLAA